MQTKDQTNPAYALGSYKNEKENKPGNNPGYVGRTNTVMGSHLPYQEDEEDNFWMTGSAPTRPRTDEAFHKGTTYHNPLMLDRQATNANLNNQGMKYSPMQGFGLTPDRSYTHRGHNAAIAMQYTAPDGSRYNMEFRAQLGSPDKTLYTALMGFYGLVAAAAAGQSGKGGSNAYTGSGGNSSAK